MLNICIKKTWSFNWVHTYLRLKEYREVLDYVFLFFILIIRENHVTIIYRNVEMGAEGPF